MPHKDIIDYQIKGSIPGVCCLFGLVGQGGPISPQIVQFIVIDLGYPPELDGEVLLVKTPHTQVTGYGKTKLILTWKLHPYCLAFIVHATREEKSLSVLPSYKLREQQQ